MTITAATAVIVLNIPRLFPQPIQLQQFSADNIYGADELEAAETQMGVDGHLTAGFINVAVQQSFYLMADSPSASFFEQWYTQQKALQETFPASGTTVLRSTGKKFTMTRGFLVRYKPMPDGDRVLKPYRHTVAWESVIPSPVS